MSRLCSSKKVEGEGGDADKMIHLDDDKDTWEDVEQVATNVSDLPNEILSTIFENLDFQRLKHVRLVCKRWHEAAEFHLKKRGIVSMYVEEDCYSRIEDFVKLMKTNKTLSQPFKDISVDLGKNTFTIPSQQHLNKLMAPPLSLVLTRLSTQLLPLKLTLPLLLRASSTLEFLKLDAGSSDDGYKPPEDAQKRFSKLWTVVVGHSSGPLGVTSWNHAPSIVSWVIKTSPNLKSYYSFLNGKYSGTNQQFDSVILLQLDLKTVETLKLSLNGLSADALEHLITTPFKRLKSLKLFNCSSKLDSIAGIVKTAGATLKSLNLYGMRSAVYPLAGFGFPVCPNMEELTLHSFPDPERYSESLQFLASHFPGLQVLNVLYFVVRDGFDWSGARPFLHVHTLRIWEVRNDGRNPLPGEFLFFKVFPVLETLYMKPTAVVKFCTLKDVELLDGVKHLGLYFRDHHNRNPAVDFSRLPVLKEIETITFVKPSKALLTLPAMNMPCLKRIRFPWSHDLNLKKMVEMFEGVERVVITNCCSIRMCGGPRLKQLLEEYLTSARNAECGCRDWELCSSRPWHPNAGVEYFKSSN